MFFRLFVKSVLPVRFIFMFFSLLSCVMARVVARIVPPDVFVVRPWSRDCFLE